MSELVEVYCDGACKGATGSPGGWGVWAPTLGNGVRLYGGEPETTNNRMELIAMMRALELVIASGMPATQFVIYSDSQYVVKGLTEWLPGWKRKGWKRGDGYNAEPIKNQDLWIELDVIYAKARPAIKWVKGHSGDPGNEMSDLLSNKGVRDMAGVNLDTLLAQMEGEYEEAALPRVASPARAGKPLKDSSRGLLIVDLQPGFSPSPELMASLTKEFADGYDFVAATVFSNPSVGAFRSVLNFQGMTEGDKSTELMLPFGPNMVIKKKGYGLDAASVQALHATGITTWHLCGVQADGAILACAFSLWDAGLTPVLLADYCQASKESAKKEAIAVFKRQFGKKSALK